MTPALMASSTASLSAWASELRDKGLAETQYIAMVMVVTVVILVVVLMVTMLVVIVLMPMVLMAMVSC